MDWSKCILCQDDRGGEALRCPANNSKSVIILKTTVLCLLTISKITLIWLHYLQSQNLDALDEGDCVSLTLLRYSANWHPLCKAMIKKLKIKRLQQAIKKRHASAPTHCAPDPKYTGSKFEPFSTKHCFFNCTTETNADNPLRQVMTKQLDSRLRQMMTKQLDSRLRQVMTKQLDSRLREYAKVLQDDRG